MHYYIDICIEYICSGLDKSKIYMFTGSPNIKLNNNNLSEIHEIFDKLVSNGKSDEQVMVNKIIKLLHTEKNMYSAYISPISDTFYKIIGK